MESLGLEVSYINNNYGNKDVVFRGYIYTKRTNMVKAGKKSCNYRCANIKCSASISLKTIRDSEGTNVVFEPFIVVHCQTSHDSLCKLILLKQNTKRMNQNL